jgi:hypothetical protein
MVANTGAAAAAVAYQPSRWRVISWLEGCDDRRSWAGVGKGDGMTTESADYRFRRRPERALTVEELARRQGVRPISSVEELARDDVFESDAEVDEFIEFVHALRHADLA